jgi:hypothetical protein
MLRLPRSRGPQPCVNRGERRPIQSCLFQCSESVRGSPGVPHSRKARERFLPIHGLPIPAAARFNTNRVAFSLDESSPDQVPIAICYYQSTTRLQHPQHLAKHTRWVSYMLQQTVSATGIEEIGAAAQMLCTADLDLRRRPSELGSSPRFRNQRSRWPNAAPDRSGLVVTATLLLAPSTVPAR